MFDERISTASPLRRWLNAAGAMLMCLLVLVPISGMAVNPPPRRIQVEQLMSFGFAAAFSIFWLGRAAAMVWWRCSIRFCESGILWDQKLLKWDHLLEHRWDKYDEYWPSRHRSARGRGNIQDSSPARGARDGSSALRRKGVPAVDPAGTADDPLKQHSTFDCGARCKFLQTCRKDSVVHSIVELLHHVAQLRPGERRV
jgi:hypothetical protein